MLKYRTDHASARRMLKDWYWMIEVTAVRPWARFRLTEAGYVELDTGDLIQ